MRPYGLVSFLFIKKLLETQLILQMGADREMVNRNSVIFR